MRRSDKTTFLYRIVDFFIVLICWSTAYYLRFHVMKSGDYDPDLRILSMGMVSAVLTLLFYAHNNLYTSQRYFSWYKEVFSIFKSHFQSVATLIILLYFLNPSRLSRIMLIYYAVLVVVAALAGRLIIKSVLLHRRRKGFNLKNVVLIGSNPSIREYAQRITDTPELGLHISGWMDSKGNESALGVQKIESLKDISTIPKEDTPDVLIIGYGANDYRRQNDCLTHFNKTTLPVWILPDIGHIFIGYTIESFHGIPMMSVNANRLTVLESIAKRTIDVFGSAIILAVISPLMLIIAAAVKLASPGAVFYGQERLSQDGHIFKMWKFRSMRSDAEKSSGAVWAQKNDARVTPLGAFLRKTSLDELPQFWNILIGEMSLVGPRPERPVFTEQFREEIPSYMLRHKMKAGLTGWAQVNGWRGNSSLEKRIEFDLYYIQNWSIGLDIKILFLTLLKGFVNPNAY